MMVIIVIIVIMMTKTVPFAKIRPLSASFWGVSKSPALRPLNWWDILISAYNDDDDGDVGTDVGSVVGADVGSVVGADVGSGVGADVGSVVGADEGSVVGR